MDVVLIINYILLLLIPIELILFGINYRKNNKLKKELQKQKSEIQKQKEISKYTVEKTLQYKNYLIEDIKNTLII